eukprot:3932947-Rhodomonas_salina.1
MEPRQRVRGHKTVRRTVPALTLGFNHRAEPHVRPARTHHRRVARLAPDLPIHALRPPVRA